MSSSLGIFVLTPWMSRNYVIYWYGGIGKNLSILLQTNWADFYDDSHKSFTEIHYLQGDHEKQSQRIESNASNCQFYR